MGADPSATRAFERRVALYAPYPASLYGRFLDQLRARRGIELAGAFDEPRRGSRPRVFVRLDVDTPGCVTNLPSILDANLRAGIAADAFIRTDRIDYAPETLRECVARYQERVEFGLHSSCYLADDYFPSLRQELERFRECFGFVPSHLTVHGLGEHRSEIRNRFVEDLRGRLSEFGLTFTDADPRARTYEYVLQDCNLEPGPPVRRFLYDEFLELPDIFRAGRDYLVLIHPCYWSPNE